MDFAPGLVKVTLWPRPGYVPKVLFTSFRFQVVTLHSFHPPHFASVDEHWESEKRRTIQETKHGKAWYVANIRRMLNAKQYSAICERK